LSGDPVKPGSLAAPSSGPRGGVPTSRSAHSDAAARRLPPSTATPRARRRWSTA